MLIASDTPIAVIGAGTMGRGIAQTAALAGHPVVLIDRDEAAAAAGLDVISEALSALVSKGRLDADGADAARERLRVSTSLENAAGSGVAIEAIIERIDVKRQLFTQLSAILGSDAILASNTSSLSIGEIARDIAHPERVIGLHFFNPVTLMRLVEVVAADDGGLKTARAAADLMARWGKHPVIVRDVAGFIVNRVARPYYAEAFAALGEGVPAATIDTALTGAGGFRMGPLGLADMIGHDVNYVVAETVHEAYGGHVRFRLQPAQRALRDGGLYGRKTGRGVYDYPPGPSAAQALTGPRPKLASVGPHSGLLTQIVTEACPSVREDSDLPHGFALIDGVRIALGDGRLLAARPDVDVLIDHVRDWATATAVPFTAANDKAADVVAGLIYAGRRTALAVPDRAGQLVLRTLLQLANAAADAVTDQVSDANGIDEAMIHGANHPEGPLAWATGLPAPRIAWMLGNIAEATGDPIYEPAHLFLK